MKETEHAESIHVHEYRLLMDKALFNIEEALSVAQDEELLDADERRDLWDIIDQIDEQTYVGKEL